MWLFIRSCQPNGIVQTRLPKCRPRFRGSEGWTTTLAAPVILTEVFPSPVEGMFKYSTCRVVDNLKLNHGPNFVGRRNNDNLWKTASLRLFPTGQRWQACSVVKRVFSPEKGT